MASEDMELSSLEELPVRLEFILFNRHFSLPELRKACAGEFFPLPTSAEKKVIVLANGVRIGKGELVMWDKQLGVEISEWMGMDAHA